MGITYSSVGLATWLIKGEASFGKAGFNKASAHFKASDFPESLAGTNVLVTGANAGLGRSTATDLAQRGATVHLLCRNEARGREAMEDIRRSTRNENVHLHVVDVSSATDVEAFAAKWEATGDKVDVLVLNAGVLLNKREETPAGVETTLATTINQSFLLTGLMMPALARSDRKPARIIHVASGGQYTMALDLADPQAKGARKYDGPQQYAVAKRAQVMLAEMWAERVKGAGIVVNSMHPGWAETPGVTTSLGDFAERKKGKLRTSEEGADTIIWLAGAKPGSGATETGKFFFDRAPQPTSYTLAGTAASPAQYKELWARCPEWTTPSTWKWEGSPQEAAITAASSGGAGAPVA